ncbi:hypothetical protein LC593_20820 [Nostoc sp. CHAB 5844]|nr:hypothetical protein [Nostoc sp. CHAB 5844]
MTQTFKVCFSYPEHGWITVEIFSKEKQLLFPVSYTPYNSFVELLDALITILSGRDQAVVRWNTEPIKYKFLFAKNDEQLTLEIIKIVDLQKKTLQNEVLFNINSLDIFIVLQFWRALRHLETYKNFEKQWGLAFPKREMRLLEKCIQNYKSNHKSVV